jgi:hypothetical protein
VDESDEDSAAGISSASAPAGQSIAAPSAATGISPPITDIASVDVATAE